MPPGRPQFRIVRTSWFVRVLVVVSLLGLVAVTQRLWTPIVGRSLVCSGQTASADAILIENFDPNYLLFERASALYQAKAAQKIFVSATAGADGQPSLVDRGVIDVMVRVARLAPPEVIPIRETEPIAFNTVKQIRTVLVESGIRSVIVVTSGFRSRRSSLVYLAVLGQAGIAVSCDPVFGQHTPENWTRTWHGIEDVTEQFFKLQYYRFYVMPIYS